MPAEQLDLETHVGQRDVHNAQRRNDDRPRRLLHRPALAGQLVQRRALVLEGGIHRRLLPLGPQEAVENGSQLGFGQVRDRCLADHLAGGILGVGGDAQAQQRFVALVAVQKEAGQAGGLIDTAQQHAGGEGVQRAGMSHLGGAQTSFHFGHGLGRSDAAPVYPKR